MFSKYQEDLFRVNPLSKSITDYFQHEYEAGKKVIALFAIGGGNDTLSAIHLGQYFKKKFGFEVLFFGALGFTPYHSDQQPINIGNVENK